MTSRLTLVPALILLSACALAGTTPTPVSLHVNGRPVATDVPPQIIADTTFVPLRAVTEALGAEIVWMPETKTALLCLDNRCCSVCVSDPASGAQIINGRTMVPLRKTAELLGCQVAWDAAARCVRVTAPKTQPHR